MPSGAECGPTKASLFNRPRQSALVSAAHAPSRARALVAEARSGRPVRELAGEARRIGDPYHAAWALFHLSRDDPGLRRDALELLEKVPQPWRRAELAADVIRSVRDDADMAARLAAIVLDMPHGEARSDALRSIVKGVDAAVLPLLLGRVVEDNPNAIEDGKTILRVWVTSPAGSVEAALERAVPAVRARLLGYLHLQAGGTGEPIVAGALRLAVSAAEGAPDRMEILRYLASVAHTADELDELLATGLSPTDHGRLLSAAVARADRLGHPEKARSYLQQAIEVAARIDDAHDRSRLRANLAEGAERLGLHAQAEELRAQAQTERVPRAAAPAPARTTSPAAPRSSGFRPVLGLHNGYEGALGPPHLRAAARAAPLCVAFGLDLLLIGFPGNDLRSFVQRVESETRVGDGAEYVRTLFDAHRISWVPKSHHAHPHAWNMPGPIVATTPQPDPRKATDLRQLGGAPVLVMGLGPEGLPDSILREAPYHLELTGHNVPLETATAMGVLAERLRSVFSA